MNTTGLLKKLIACRKLLVSAGVLATALFASAPASAAQWLTCAGEGGTCVTSSSGNDVTYRYGTDGVYYYAELMNTDSAPCKSAYGFGLSPFGDPVQGKVKHCDVYPARFSGPMSTNVCATRGQTCNIPAGTLTWVYFGQSGGGTRVSALVSKSFTCNTDYCWVGNKAFSTTGGWTLCATSEGQNCTPESYEQIVVAYGAGDAFVYMLATVEPGKSIPCNGSAFPYDPAYGTKKSCYYKAITLSNTAVHTAVKGYWKNMHNLASGVGDLSYTLMFGTQTTTTASYGNAWTTTVTGTVNSGGIEGSGVSLSVAQSFARSSLFTDSLATNYGVTFGTACKSTSNNGAALWQYVMASTAGCLASGTCTADSFVHSYACTQNNSKGNFVAPKCLPGHCVGTSCQVCS